MMLKQNMKQMDKFLEKEEEKRYLIKSLNYK